jgi:lipoprotein Spr
MLRNLVVATSFILLLASCATMRPTGSANAKPVVSKPVTASKSAVATKPAETKKNDVKFLDEITANPQLTTAIPDVTTEKKEVSYTTPVNESSNAGKTSSSENLSSLQLKYGQLLGTRPEQVENSELLKSVDYWYGTPYLMGGSSKSGIDCSAFVQAVYLAAFSMVVPRTAFEQFRVTNRISAVEMREGDLVFFNTLGGVSHVGIYLRNNKFIHASSSRGVTVSDLFDPYYLKRFLGVGRIEKPLGTR